MSSVVVMVVDDDHSFREALTAVLQQERYEVLPCANGLEALHHLESGAGLPRLILLDLVHPLMDGWRFVHEQRLRPSIAHIPVVLISAERDLAHHANDLGVAAYLRKPIDIDPLLAMVRRLAGPPDSAP